MLMDGEVYIQYSVCVSVVTFFATIHKKVAKNNANRFSATQGQFNFGKSVEEHDNQVKKPISWRHQMLQQG